MCGIAGSLGSVPGLEGALRRIGASLSHRGPDDEGVWLDESAGIGFVHRRLSIIDLSAAGHQPMHSADGRHVIVFNGEIYNHPQLRAELEAEKGSIAWRGHSDTETLLCGFETWGIEPTLRKAVGMFAFALWDRQSRTLTLARDRLGEKPLYYGWSRNVLLFGSELKALRAHPAFEPRIDRDALAAFMRYSYVPAPQSIYQGIFKLTPGTILTVRAGDSSARPQPAPYWSLINVASEGLRSPFTGTDEEAVQGLESRLGEAVALQQLADVPLGAFLSGGVDSSAIVALMQAQSSRPVHTFTIGSAEEQYDEAKYASAVARHLGTHHTELTVTSDEAQAVIPRLPALYDEPFGDSSQIPTFLVCQLARRQVTVSLSGDAGDELFGGYNRYVWANRVFKLPARVRGMMAGGLTALRPDHWDRFYGAVRALLPQSVRVENPGDKAHKLASLLAARSEAAIYEHMVSTWTDPATLVQGVNESSGCGAAWAQVEGFGAWENQMMALDAITYLPDDILCKVDRAAMGVSLETRVPFLDHRVVEYAWRLPLHMKIRGEQRTGKWILRQLLYKYVPRELIERPKKGFGVPIGSWLRGPLREWAESLLDRSRLQADGYLNPAPILRKWEEHLSGARNWQAQLWNVLVFQEWLASQRA